MRLFAAIAFIVSVFAINAMAQNIGTGAPKSDSSTTAPKAAVSAPVGHRQPTATSVGKPENDAISVEDKELDRKIKNICRGC